MGFGVLTVQRGLIALLLLSGGVEDELPLIV